MKLFVLTLALAVLTGSWAFVLRDEPETRLDKLIQEAEQYMRNFSDTAHEKVAVIARSDLGHTVSGLFGGSVWNITKRWIHLTEELPTEVVEVGKLAERVVQQVSRKAERAQSNLRRIMEPPKERFLEALKSELSVSADPALERLGPFIQDLRHSLDTRRQALETKLDESLPQQLKSLTTHLKPYIYKWPELHEFLKPYVDDIQQRFRVGVETVHKHVLKSYIETILESAPRYEEELNKWAAAPVYPQNP